MGKFEKMVFWYTLLLLSAIVLGECRCRCDPDDEEKSKSKTLYYKLGAIASILIASAIGVCIPVLGKAIPALSPERNFFFIIKAFAAGVILSTGFIHVLPDAFHKLTPPYLEEHPWVLELGIIVHSVIIGIALGASQNIKTVRTLFGALTFHQFFEGMGLGGSIAQAKFKSRAVTIMALFFSLTTPIGIAIGLAITKGYHENDNKALIVQGIFNSASAGILIYMALVDLLAADFMHPRMQGNGKLQLGANISLLLGAGLMSMLAKWA